MERRGAVILIALAVIGLSVGGLVTLAIRGDNGGTNSASGESGTTTTATSPAEESTTSTSAAASNPNATAAVQAPQQGTYTYAETDRYDGRAPTSRSFTLKIVAKPDQNGRFRREVTNSKGGVEEQAWGRDAVFSTDAVGQDGCQWQPPRELYAATLQVGATWSYDSTCSNAPTDTQTHDQAQFKVTSVNSDQTWTIHRVETATVTHAGQITQVTGLDGDLRFDPVRGLIVQEHDVITTKGALFSTVADVHLT